MTRCAQRSVLSSVPHWRHSEDRLAGSISTFRETRPRRRRSISNDPARHKRRLRADPAASRQPSPGLARRQVIETPYLSTVSLGELLSGVENLPVGRRRTALAAALERQIADLFDDRIISFDIAVKAYAKAVARARGQGHMISIADGQIAGIASSRDPRVASRDETPFRAAGVTVINPWTAES